MIDIILSIRSTRQYPAEECLSKCLDTLHQHTKDYRIIAVDDNSDEVGRSHISNMVDTHPAFSKSSHLIRTQKQRWFTRAYNLGLRLARSPWVVTLNVDLELGEGWLEELFAVKDEAEAQLGVHVGLVGSEMSMEDPRRWQNITSPSVPGNPGYCTGHCWLLNMQALYEASASRGTPGIYLDETNQRNIHIFSDNEISYKLQSLGWLTIRSFKALVGHRGGATWGHDLGKVMSLRLEEVND